MSETATFLSALLVGLLGAGHCAGMCGGIVGVLSIGSESLSTVGRLMRTLAYNTGRVASYVAAGGMAGYAGQTLGGLLPSGAAPVVAMSLSAAFAVLLALYLIGRGGLLVRLEGLGAKVWRYLRPVGQRFIPARTAPRAFALGAVWGWLPCGLVYTVLAWSLASGSPTRGAVLMLGFGLGTLPALVTMGMAGSWLVQWRDRPLVRYTASVVLVGIAVGTLWHGLGPAGMHVGHSH